ncbi:MAG TPA: penicillin-binding protein 1C, partial [Bacteroidales bacterium]|nr:penicillin-binding protein 1C [Bacteroidales bacterium]
EWYYRNHHPVYKPLPPMHEACNDNAVAGDEIMEVVYPSNLSQIFIPRGLSGEQGNVIFEITHRNRNTTLYWHVDNTFIGTTTAPHKMAVQMPQGQHRLTVVDADGNSISRSFTVLNQRP